MNAPPAIRVQSLCHNYGKRRALHQVSFDVGAGEIFAVLGPNGGGKTTLFRVLTTLVTPQTGHVEILGNDIVAELAAVRSSIGVVFQAPSVDRKLTVQENLFQQAALYSLPRPQYAERSAALLDRMGLAGRRNDPVEQLSGGLRRRVELAKGMIHGPRVLLMDEPSTGLDPGARADLWSLLRQLRDELQVTVAMTTHLLEEAERADRIAILNEGELVALDTPTALRSELGGDVITIETAQPKELLAELTTRLKLKGQIVDGTVRLEEPDGHRVIPRIVESFPDRVGAIRLGRPTLEDVFIHKTGHRFWQEGS